MTWEPVDVFVSSKLTGDPLQGVLVRFFNPAGSVAFTQGVTNVDGAASVLLPNGSYSLRAYLFGYEFGPPQLFDVVVVPQNTQNPNRFNVKATHMEEPISNDVRLCRCSGYFRDLNGGPKRYLDMHITSEFDPLILEGAAVISGGIGIRTDENGWVQVDLIRGGNYEFVVEAMNCQRVVMVPDMPSANLPDMFFPVVERIVLEDDLPLAVPLAAELVITPTVLASSGVPLIGTASDDVTWKMDDSNIASLQVKETTLVLTGVAVGTTTLTATRKDSSIIRIPNTPIQGQPIQVVVA